MRNLCSHTRRTFLSLFLVCLSNRWTEKTILVQADCLPETPSIFEQFVQSDVVVRIQAVPDAVPYETFRAPCNWEAYNGTGYFLRNTIVLYPVVDRYKGLDNNVNMSHIPIVYDTDTGPVLEPSRFMAGTTDDSYVVFLKQEDWCKDDQGNPIPYPDNTAVVVHVASECWRHPKWSTLSTSDQSFLAGGSAGFLPNGFNAVTVLLLALMSMCTVV